jgi:hypothetical protein
MQIMADTLTDSPKMLRLTAAFLDDAAAVREGELAGPQRSIDDMALDHGIVRREAIDVDFNKSPLPPPPLDPAAIFGANSQPEPGPSRGVTRIQGVEVLPGELTARLAEYTGLPPAPPPVSLPPLAPGPQAADEFDSAGWPYDLRIHNDKRSKKLDGTWKYRKKTPEAIITQVENEITAAGRRRIPAAAQSAQLSIPMTTAGQPMPAPPPPPPPPPVLLPQSQTQNGQTQAPPPPPQAQSPQASALSFTTVMTKITEAMAAKKLTLDQLGLFLSSKGLPPKDIVGIGGHPQLWQEVVDYVAQLSQ